MGTERGSAAPFPDRVGRYDILLPLGTGGLATVYLARARGIGGFEREVALKLVHSHLRARDGWAVELIEEAKLASRVRHPNVVPVLDVGDDPFGVFLVLEYVEGDTLSGLLRLARQRGTTLPRPVLLRILIDALAGLHAAHETRDDEGHPLHLVHRDFSPQNILIGVDGTSRLTDFGIAKSRTRVGFTRDGLIKGKISYMSPEQARGEPLDRRSDVWAAGVVAWELLAGRRLFKASDEVATLLRVVTEKAPRVATVSPDIPAALDDAVSSALQGAPAARCPTAQELSRRIVEGARAVGGVAEPVEVARVIGELLVDQLKERRERVRALIGLRAQMGRLAAPVSQQLATPSSDPEADTDQEPALKRNETHDLEATDTAAALESAAYSTPRRRRAWWVAAVAIPCGGAAVAYYAFGPWRVREVASETPQSSQPVPAASPSHEPTPSRESTSIPSAEPVPAPVASEQPKPQKPATPRTRPQPKPAKSAAAPPPIRDLPPSPYE
jgi:serine/threonine-protein kinase